MGKYLYFTIKDIANMIRERQRIRKDATIFIDGFKGQGKSTCGWKLARKLGKYTIEHNGVTYQTKKFKPERDMFYARQDVIDFITQRKFSVGLVDEMINVGYNREFSNTDQQAIIKALNQFRSPHYNVLIALNPQFYDMDKDFRNLFWMRFDIIRRGVALVHVVRESLYGDDPWDTNYNRKVEEKWRKNNGKIKPRYEQLTTFKGILVFNPMKPKEEEYYERVRNYKRGLANKSLSGQVPEKTQTVYDNMVKMSLDGKLTKELFDNVCSINNLDPIRVRAYINKKLKENNVGKTLNKLIVKEPIKEVKTDELGYAMNL